MLNYAYPLVFFLNRPKEYTVTDFNWIAILDQQQIAIKLIPIQIMTSTRRPNVH